MAQKRKAGGTSAPSSEEAGAVITAPEVGRESTKADEVEDIANGTFEVQLEECGVSAEDIAAYRRIDARLAEVAANARQAARAAQPSTSQMMTRGRGKETESASNEAVEQYRRLREDELQYDGEVDPRDFLLKYEASVESNGGGPAIKAKAFVPALKGSAQHWYASLPKGYIHSRSQLRLKLLTSFRGLSIEELTSCNFHNCK
ncbi:gag protein - maize [Panicum miliaceum]|uniref:Gag protein-maize n=1 Tax=Panicum miliaceum TaxID=4540 RepID=A0A3L6TLN8_PANMI|nr:gag protein - maize [Panicum miliaceum]